MLPSLAPWLTVADGHRAAKFYRAAFGAEEVYRLDGPEGSVVVRLAVGSVEFWVSGEGTGGSNEPPVGVLGGGTVRMILTVEDPDAVYAQALAAGAVEVFPVGEGHGWRLGRLVDPFGLHWEVGRPLGGH